MPLSPRRHERAGLWWVLLLALAGLTLWALGSQGRAGAERVAHEDAALAAVRTLVSAEQAYRGSAGRYGWLEDLGVGALVPTVVGAQGLEATSPGYRIQILLPSGRGSMGEVLLAPHGGTPDPLLAARYVAVVARPLKPGISGWRIFYGDETGRIFVQEGVADAEGSRANALPSARLERPKDANEPGPVWRLLETLRQD